MHRLTRIDARTRGIAPRHRTSARGLSRATESPAGRYHNGVDRGSLTRWVARRYRALNARPVPQRNPGTPGTGGDGVKGDGIALVTGASRGIGRAVALELATRGFEVVATMRDPADGEPLLEAARERGHRLRVARLDVQEPASIEIPDGLRVLVNNAGIEGEHLPVENAPLSLFREIFETNLFGLLEVTQRAIPRLRASGGGVVCNITSCSILVPMPFFAAYRASKAAVSAVGESLRSELRPFGIRVLEIQPGAIATDMLRDSNHVPQAVSCPGYEDMARRVHASRQQAASSETPAEVGAAAIADAILDPEAPLRCACDPMGAGLLEAWRRSSDEDMMRGMVELFGGQPRAGRQP